MMASNISRDCKEDILNLYNFFEKEKKHGKLRVRLERCLDRTAKALMLSQKTVENIVRKEGKLNNEKHFPQGNVDKQTIRTRMQQFFHDKQLLSIKQLKHSLQDTFTISTGLQCKTLFELGYTIKRTADKKKCLAESWNTMAQNVNFLREIRQSRDKGREIVYLGETWVNVHHERSSQWFDEKGASSRVSPAGKGQRLIILHDGSADRGFLPGCKLVFRGSKGSEDYHQEMKGECFNDWFEQQLLPVLDNPSVIVLYNATYHNVRVPGTESPTKAWKKTRIIEWLQVRNMAFEAEPTMLTPKVYAITKRHKPPIQYLTDQLSNVRSI